MEKKVKIIYFSVLDSDAKQLELPWGKFVTLLCATFLVLLFLVSATVAIFTDFYHSMEVASLSKLNNLLEQQLNDMGSQISKIDKKIETLEKEDDDLRIVANLPRIDPDTRDVGVGGFQAVNFTGPLGSDELSGQVLEYHDLLDKMERRFELAQASRDEIQGKLEFNALQMKHTPSIRPLMDGRITDRFGMRVHPIIEKVKRHPGIDISAERGTEVFATAAGTVEKIVTSYKLNRGYGKYVVIDHGFGVKTLYGHLAKILVRPGETVGRWDAIGLVGETGLATGPHLHYEVWKDDQRQDPMDYILN